MYQGLRWLSYWIRLLIRVTMKSATLMIWCVLKMFLSFILICWVIPNILYSCILKMYECLPTFPHLLWLKDLDDAYCTAIIWQIWQLIKWWLAFWCEKNITHINCKLGVFMWTFQICYDLRNISDFHTGPCFIVS